MLPMTVAPQAKEAVQLSEDARHRLLGSQHGRLWQLKRKPCSMLNRCPATGYFAAGTARQWPPGGVTCHGLRRQRRLGPTSEGGP
mmetsp:Transcript_56114/g.174394  ORF Transcript_56114/g.174394 Transcript_56114/m.174394 type:complete len:85 (+) Transcript_56114:839-1093(+)